MANKTAKKGLLFISMMIILATSYRLVGHLTLDQSRAINLTTTLDQIMPLIPELTLVYMTIYFMWLPLVFSENISYEYFRQTVYATYIAFAVLYIFYFIMPSTYPRPELENYNCWKYALLRLLYNYDLPNNTFPSSHAAGVTILLLASAGKFTSIKMILYKIWGCTIIFSTFAIKQHYVMDTLIGALIGILIYKKYTRQNTQSNLAQSHHN